MSGKGANKVRGGSRKVGDDPRQMTVTPSGADPATLEQMNPPAAVDDEHRDDDGESRPLVKDIANHDHIVEAQHQGGDPGPAMNREGIYGTDRDFRSNRIGGGEDTSQDGPDTDSFSSQGEPYDLFAHSGAQQPGGGAHSMTEPSNKANADVEGAAKVSAMISHMPKDTPDDHTVYGYAGYKLTIGDLRKIAEKNNEEEALSGEGAEDDTGGD